MQSRMSVLRREGRSLVSRVEKALADLRKAAPCPFGFALIPPTPTSFTSTKASEVVEFGDECRGGYRADSVMVRL